MATITKRGAKWFAQVRKRGHSTSKSHPTKAAAQTWAARVEAEIESGAYGAAPLDTIVQLIDEYQAERANSGRPVRRNSNEQYMLKRLSDRLGHLKVADAKVADIVAFAQQRKVMDGVGPYTIAMDISKLGTVIRHMKSLKGLSIKNVVEDAKPSLDHLQLTGPSNARDRRPTIEEIRAMMAWFQAKFESGGTNIPMVDILTVSMTTGLRRGELFRILWDDLDLHRRMILVRDRKDPRHKTGNNQWVPLLPEAMEVIGRQPKADARIFPYGVQRVSQLFREACRGCGIKDLRLHDLRHEAASSLFEAGWDIPEVAMVTGHKNWKTLQRYTNLRPDDLHDNVVPISKAKKVREA